MAARKVRSGRPRSGADENFESEARYVYESERPSGRPGRPATANMKSVFKSTKKNIKGTKKK